MLSRMNPHRSLNKWTRTVLARIMSDANHTVHLFSQSDHSVSFKIIVPLKVFVSFKLFIT